MLRVLAVLIGCDPTIAGHVHLTAIREILAIARHAVDSFSQFVPFADRL